MHLHSYFGFSENNKGIDTLRIFIAVGIFILIIACINFSNLSTARYSARSREIGMRKINGAHRKNLIFQFLSESIIVSITATAIAIILVTLLLPVFNRITGKNFAPSDLTELSFVAGILIISLVKGVLSGIYPSLVLSSMNPLNIIKNSFFKGNSKGWFRKILVVTQFSLSIILIIGSITIYQQLRFMQNMEPGYDKNNLLYIYLQGELKKSYPALKTRLIQLPEIESITSSYHPPHRIYSNSGSFDYQGKDPDKDILVSFGGVGYNYIKTMKINMKEGRSFSREYGTDKIRDTLGSFMINEELKRVMGIEDVIGKEIKFNGIRGPVVGVMEDYHYQSARNSIEPLALVIAPEECISYMFIRLSQGNISNKINQIEKEWNELMPLYPFDYKFVDQDFETMYRLEERMGSLLRAFTIIAIIVAGVSIFWQALRAATRNPFESLRYE